MWSCCLRYMQASPSRLAPPRFSARRLEGFCLRIPGAKLARRIQDKLTTLISLFESAASLNSLLTYRLDLCQSSFRIILNIQGRGFLDWLGRFITKNFSFSSALHPQVKPKMEDAKPYFVQSLRNFLACNVQKSGSLNKSMLKLGP